MAKAPAKQTEAKVPATVGASALPAYLQGQNRASGLQGLDQSDFIIPRIKLLQAISPEVEQFEDAKAGIFWLNVLDIPLGPTLDFVPISNKKRYLLMAQLGQTPKGIMARADDGVHWKPPNGSWDVTLKGRRGTVKWETKPTVRESGLGEFGTMDPENPDSNPAATLFYEYLVYLPDFPDLSPVLLSLARSQAKKARDLNGKIELRKAPMQSMRFRAGIEIVPGDEGPYNNYTFASNGWATEQEFAHCNDLAARITDYRGADEEGAVAAEVGGVGGKPVDTKGEY